MASWHMHIISDCAVCTPHASPLPADNTAGIVTRRAGFRRRAQESYQLPVVMEDGGYPPQSSTGTLSIRVCGCDSQGSLLSCNVEAVFLPVGLSTGALVAILLCIVILLGELWPRFAILLPAQLTVLCRLSDLNP